MRTKLFIFLKVFLFNSTSSSVPINYVFIPSPRPFFFRMDTFTDDFNFSMNSSIRLIKFENKSWKNTSENLLKHKMRTKSLENIFVSDAKKLADFDWHMESDDRLKGFVKTMKGQKKQCLPMIFTDFQPHKPQQHSTVAWSMISHQYINCESLLYQNFH